MSMISTHMHVDADASNGLRQLRVMLRIELMRLWRNGGFVFFTLAFPALFYLLLVHMFGVGGVSLDGISVKAYLLVSMTAYGVMGAGLNLFGARLAHERSQGWMRLLRATPVRPLPQLAARWGGGLLFSAVVVIVMLAIGAWQGVSFGAGTWLTTAALLWMGALPFGALGLALGYWIDVKSGQVIVTMVYFFLSIFGGLWWPLEMMPPLMRQIATYLPSNHYAHLVRQAMLHQLATTAVLVLVGYTVLFLVLAWWGWRRDEERVYG